jgi:hypothetical protein
MLSYIEGGKDEEKKTTKIGKKKYVIGEHFRGRFNDTLADWNAFLTTYNERIKDNILFDEAVNLLGLNDNQTIRENILDAVKYVYGFTDRDHVAVMSKQYSVHEPLAYSIFNIFNLIKSHYEKIVREFLEARNAYIDKNKLNAADKNDWNYLIDLWGDLEVKHGIETSSLVLYYLNPPQGVDNQIKINISADEKIKKQIEKLKKAISKFKYLGYCRKVPYTRLIKLLEFPLDVFIDTIKLLNPKYKPFDYSLLEKAIGTILKSSRLKNPLKELKNNIPRENPPKDYNMIALIQWYIQKILELRSKLVPVGRKLEIYYGDLAKTIDDIYKMLRKHL